MHPDVAKLIVLQRHDLEARRLREEMVALPKLAADAETRAKAAVGQRAVIVDLIAKEEALRRRLESDVKDQQQKIERSRKKIDAATEIKHVTAFEHEITFAEAEIVKLEDAELEGMERSEGLDEQKKKADEAVAVTAELATAAKAKAERVVTADRLALAEVEKLRVAQRALVSEAALSNYDRILKGKGTAVAEAVGQACSECKMMIRPQRWNDLADNSNQDAIMTCETCGRMLYYDPARDAPQRKAVPVESIAVSIIRSMRN